MLLLKLCLFYLVSRCQAIYNVAFNNSILFTNIMSNTMTTKNFGLISGTPYDNILDRPEIYWQFGSPETIFASVDVDYARKVVYLYNSEDNKIYAISNFTWENDFSNFSSSVVHNGIARDLVKLAYDWVNYNIYWTDPLYRWIVIQSALVDGAYKVLIQDDIERPYAIAVDPIDRYLFWSDIGSSVKIERSSLSGTDRRTIIYNGLLQPLSIDIDLKTSSIVWVDAEKGTVETANFDGDNRQMIRRVSDSYFFDVSVFQNLIYVTDDNSSYLTFNKSTGAEYDQASTKTNGDFYLAIAIYSSETQPQKSDYCFSNPCGDICVSGTFSAECLCREGFMLNADKRTCYEGSSYRSIIWCNSTTFCLKDIRLFTTPDHANDIACVFTTNSDNSDASGISYFDVDTVERKIIYSSGSSIYSVNIGANPVARKILTATDTITGIALDWRDKNVYWTTRGGKISLVSQQTTLAHTLASSGLKNPRDLKILPLDEFLLWISGTYGASKIERSLLTGNVRLTLVKQLINPAAIAVDTNLVYWSDSGDIWKCSLDGAGRKKLSTMSFIRLPGIIVLYKDYLAVTDKGKLKAFNANETEPEYVIADAPGLIAIHILDPFLQPQQRGPCDVRNGDCEHICFPLGLSKVCKCLYGFTLDSNAKTCSSQLISDNFLFLTDYTFNKIYQLSLDTGVVRAVDVDIGANPTGVIYNYMSHKVIWSCVTTRVIRSVNLDGTGYTTLLNTGMNGAYADRFAIDFTSGNLYYTSVATQLNGFSGVGVISPTGKHKKLIENGESPRTVVVDPSEGLMFWTELDANPPFVKKANMDGSNPLTIVSTNIDWPNGLAIDYEDKILYLTDDFNNIIWKCTYNGDCTFFYTDPNAQLMDIQHYDGYLFYTAWNRQYVTKIKKNDTNDISKLVYNAELGRLDSISIYKSSSRKQPVSDACLSNGGLGPCSTFCFPSPTGFTCGCEDNINLRADRYTCENVDPISSSSSTTAAATSTAAANSTQTATSTSTSQTSVGMIAGLAGGISFLVLIVVILVLVLRRLSICNRKPTPTQTGSNDQHPIYPINGSDTCSDYDIIMSSYGTQNAEFNKYMSSNLILTQPLTNEYNRIQRPAEIGYESLQVSKRTEVPFESSKNVAKQNNVLPLIPTEKNANRAQFPDHQNKGFVSESEGNVLQSEDTSLSSDYLRPI